MRMGVTWLPIIGKKPNELLVLCVRNSHYEFIHTLNREATFDITKLEVLGNR